VFPEESVTDAHGNLRTRASSTGVVCTAVVQPIAAPTEDQSIGFETRSKYRLRLVGYQSMLGAQAQVEWQGERYSIDEEPGQYNGSRRTRHLDYVIARSLSLLTAWRGSP
jgi:hypothetical protein